MSYLDIALKAIEDLKTEPTERQKNLNTSINAIADKTVADIINIGRWKSSRETIRREGEANKIQHEIISGKGKLIDFREAVKRWKQEGIK